MIHDNALRSKKLNAVSLGAGELWFRILLLVDDNGNYFGDRLVIYANAMRSKKGVTAQSVSKFVDELIEVGLLEQYVVPEEDEPYIHVVNFHEYQYFKTDRPVKVTYPVHPTGPYFAETGKTQLEDRMEPGRNQADSTEIPNVRPEVEVEVEVEVEGEVKDSVKGSDADCPEPNFASFQKCFKQAAGKTPKPFHRNIERYEILCRKYGEQKVLDAINDFVDMKGGKHVTRKDEWAAKNFLDDFAEDFLDAKLEPESEAVNGARRTGEGRSARVERETDKNLEEFLRGEKTAAGGRGAA